MSTTQKRATTISSRPAHTSAARSGRSAATVYRAMSRASPSTRRGSHNTAPMQAATITPNTEMGQIRRTTSGATIRASTAIFAAPSGLWAARWYESGGDDAQSTAWPQASRASSTSSAQRPAARFARYPAGLSILMVAIVPRSGVRSSQPPGPGADEDRGVPAQQRESGPRCERVRHVSRPAPDDASRVRGQVLGQVVADRGRQQRRQQRDDEEHRGEGSDSRRGVAQQRAQGEADQAGHGYVQGGADDRSQGIMSRHRHPEVVAAQQRLTEEERDEAGRERDGEDAAREDGQLPPQYRQAARHRGQRRADHPGAVLTAGQQHAQHPEGHHGEDDTVQAGGNRIEGGSLSPAEGVVLAGGHAREQRAEADHQHDGGQQGPHGGPQGAELGELREQHPALGHPQRGHPGRGRCRGGGGEDGAHREATASAASQERKSTESSVSCMNAASSDACWVVSSKTGRWACQAAAPICSAVRPRTCRTPDSSLVTVMCGPSSSSRSRTATGLRTVTALPPARATNSATVVSAISRPRPITTSRAAVSAISLIRCEDTNTV